MTTETEQQKFIRFKGYLENEEILVKFKDKEEIARGTTKFDGEYFSFIPSGEEVEEETTLNELQDITTPLCWEYTSAIKSTSNVIACISSYGYKVYCGAEVEFVAYKDEIICYGGTSTELNQQLSLNRATNLLNKYLEKEAVTLLEGIKFDKELKKVILERIWKEYTSKNNVKFPDFDIYVKNTGRTVVKYKLRIGTKEYSSSETAIRYNPELNQQEIKDSFNAIYNARNYVDNRSFEDMCINRLIDDVEYTSIEQGLKEAIKNQLDFCPLCGKHHRTKGAGIHSLCSDCQTKNRMFICRIDRILYELKDMKQIRDIKIHKKNIGELVKCDGCGELELYGRRTYISGRRFCSVCADRFIKEEKIHKCSTCRNWKFTNEMESEKFCIECFKRSLSEVHDYNARFDRIPHIKGFQKSELDTEDEKLFIGVELEINQKDLWEDCGRCDCDDDDWECYDEREIGGYESRADIVKSAGNGDYIFFKSDGSLDENGIEICTAPITINRAREIWNYDLFNNLEENFEEGDYEYGIHIHLSREGFDNTRHLARFALFFSQVDNEEFLEKIAKRRCNSWCKVCDKGVEELEKNLSYSQNYGRYEAINLTNRATVEVRIFKGTLDYSEFTSYIDFIENIFEYSKGENNIMRDNNFKKWIEKQQKKGNK